MPDRLVPNAAMLHEYMSTRGLSAEKTGKLADVDRKTITKCLDGHSIKKYTAIKIATNLSLNLNQFLGGEVSKNFKSDFLVEFDSEENKYKNVISDDGYHHWNVHGFDDHAIHLCDIYTQDILLQKLTESHMERIPGVNRIRYKADVLNTKKDPANLERLIRELHNELENTKNIKNYNKTAAKENIDDFLNELFATSKIENTIKEIERLGIDVLIACYDLWDFAEDEDGGYHLWRRSAEAVVFIKEKKHQTEPFFARVIVGCQPGLCLTKDNTNLDRPVHVEGRVWEPGTNWNAS